ncbi:hypothetical protein [Paenibacillus sp. YN15]|uniref:hypothetical protein n=1 Tax=Paenibacillus sp. YN15 TaxID=1742774 RepID=UPI000DCB2204|nr:hypothetical protein [Paenibacillus sp. YN15]RAV01016.1 hypothetical protein DQG13_13565 [Paenibacillus sp. YN15]
MRVGIGAALLAAIVVVVAGWSVLYASGRTEQDAVRIAQVNGMDVTALEFRQELDRQRAGVIDHFYRTYGAVYTESFWDTSYGGENPETVVKTRAMEELVKRKVELELGSRFGLLSGTAYRDLLEEMNKENKRRAEAVKARLPVYGPVSMDETVFIPYYMSKLRNELKEKVTPQELGVTEEELLRLKERERNPILPAEDRVRFQKLAVSYRQGEPLHVLKQRLEQAAQETPPSGAGIQVTEEELNGETAGIYFKSQPMLYSVLAGGLEKGQASPVFDEALQGQLVLVKVLERESVDSGSSGSSGDALGSGGGNGKAGKKAAAESLDELYREHVEQLASAAEVILFREGYDRITMK